jgi:hypothetical protein|tara:strand:- start:1396 stop:1752 length:357 start_codon:yes stop_codon:yes gene_type:complete
MFNNYTAQATTGAAGGFTLAFGGLDMAALRVECVLGETPMVDKEVSLSAKKYDVASLMIGEKFISYDLILRMMLKDGVITRQSKVKIGATGRLREVYDCKTQKAYRMWGKTYYGCVTK